MRFFAWIGLSIMFFVGWNYGVKSFSPGVPNVDILTSFGIMAIIGVIGWITSKE